MTSYERDDCLALVERSPQAVAVHDRGAWLDLFSSTATVEDPVGAAPHCRPFPPCEPGGALDPLGHFYDTFIAPNTVHFQPEADVVCDLEVMRDLTLIIETAPGAAVCVPMHLLYQLTVEKGELRIDRLAAHWELSAMLRQQIGNGAAFARVGMQSVSRLWQHFGASGLLGFGVALRSVGRAGKEQVRRFERYYNEGNCARMAALFANDTPLLLFPGSQGGPAEVSIEQGEGCTLHFTKLIAAGDVVSATVQMHAGSGCRGGVALFTLDRTSMRLQSAAFYW